MKLIKMNQDKTDPTVIKSIEKCLELAKKGGVENCAIVMTHNDNTVSDVWANGKDPYLVIGALESLKQEFIDSTIEKREIDD